MNQHDEDFDAGKRAAARELQPMVDAISEAIFLFNALGKWTPPTKEQRNFIGQCREMGKQLDRLLKLSGLRGTPPEIPPRPEPSVPFRKG
jgi:hypothetical protein